MVNAADLLCDGVSPNAADVSGEALGSDNESTKVERQVMPKTGKKQKRAMKEGKPRKERKPKWPKGKKEVGIVKGM
jgi:hypothetical protein